MTDQELFGGLDRLPRSWVKGGLRALLTPRLRRDCLPAPRPLLPLDTHSKSWWGWASVIAAPWAVISATAWNLTGFWSPDGAGFVNLVIYIAWVGGTSLMLLRSGNRAAA